MNWSARRKSGVYRDLCGGVGDKTKTRGAAAPNHQKKTRKTIFPVSAFPQFSHNLFHNFSIFPQFPLLKVIGRVFPTFYLSKVFPQFSHNSGHSVFLRPVSALEWPNEPDRGFQLIHLRDQHTHSVQGVQDVGRQLSIIYIYIYSPSLYLLEPNCQDSPQNLYPHK